MTEKITLIMRRRSNHFTHVKKLNAYDLSDLVKENSVKYTTDFNYSAAELEFELVEHTDPIIPYTGDIISFSWEGHKIFYGYVFKYETDNSNAVKCTCYAPSRYLKNEDSIIFKTCTIADRFKNVCKRAGIKYKIVDKPRHKIKAEVCDGKTYFAMCQSAIESHLKATNHRFFILDHYDTVELRRYPYKTLKIIVGSRSEMTKFNYSVDINNTVNVVKVVHKDTKRSKNSTSTADDPRKTKIKSATVSYSSTKQWGKLQKVVMAKQKATHAKMVKQAKDELHQKDIANKQLTITTMGNIDLIAGNAVTIYIADQKRELKNCPILKSVQHFGNEYTCDLTMKAGKSWQANGSMSL